MKKWLWDLSFRIGFENIDLQHKHLFSIANELLAGDETDNTAAKVKTTLQKLKEYIETHFADEEDVMRKFNYPLLQEHKNVHINIVDDVKKIINSSADDLRTKNQLDIYLSAWIKDHILIEDIRFSEWLKANKLM